MEALKYLILFSSIVVAGLAQGENQPIKDLMVLTSTDGVHYEPVPLSELLRAGESTQPLWSRERIP